MYQQRLIPFNPLPWSPIHRHTPDAHADLLDRRRRLDPYNLRTRALTRPPSHRQLLKLPSLLEEDPLKTLDEATVELISHLEKEKGPLRKRLTLSRKAHSKLLDVNAGAVEAFEAFGRTFFNRWLSKDNVEICLSGQLGPDLLGQTHVPHHVGNKKVLIRLNGRLLLASRARRDISFIDQLFSAILHQMIHAYFLVRCGPPIQTKDADGRLKHEEHFGAVMYKIKEVSTCTLGPLPIGFGHSLQRPKRVYDLRDAGRSLQQLNQQHPNLSKNDRHHCTECTNEIEPMSEEHLTAWYRNDCFKSANPDIWSFDGFELKCKPLSEIAEPKEEYVELIWSKKRFKVARRKVSKIKSDFGRNFDNGKRELKIPKCSQQTMQALIEFLKDKDYSPSYGDAKTNGGRAPALIMGFMPEWPTFLLHEINVHKLATALAFDELRLRALSRLKDQHRTYEDIVAVFAAIYNTDDCGRGSIHRELREWAVSFLKRCGDVPDGKPAIESSNWAKLSDDFVFQDVMMRTRIHSQALDLDFLQAKTELEAIPVTPVAAEEKKPDTFPGVNILTLPHPYPLTFPALPALPPGIQTPTSAPLLYQEQYSARPPIQPCLPAPSSSYHWHPILGAYPQCAQHCPDRGVDRACFHERDAIEAMWKRYWREQDRERRASVDYELEDWEGFLGSDGRWHRFRI